MNKRIIFDKDDNYGIFNLKEYYPYKRENHVLLDKYDKLLNTKSIKIEIDCLIIDKAIEFLQECKKEIK
ncbi:hypothetical protein [Spiroplasma endosymbiont of Ammophila pubescens]|uniref:hypothetical protein n=1 Tax=Spiroplasma endosymbiont of Ammophila pubescens TaxID=3066315 RepID=UPI0032B28F44